MPDPGIQLGLRQNWRQFAWLVLINAFVGGMVGLERTILPELAEHEFGLAVRTAILSFIVVFGITKALANYYAGALANRFGRKHLLLAGWILALPVPLLLIYAPRWEWVVFANALLGVHQGLCWSSTVVMKIDLVGERNRGLAMGLNEASGYLAVGVVAFATGWLASTHGLRPWPFYLGLALAAAGLLCTWLFVKDTRQYVALESKQSTVGRMQHIFRETTWVNPNLGSITQAGLVNNLNDGMVWGLLPMLLAAKGFDLHQIGVVASVYPAVWGLGQLFTGKLADVCPKKTMLVGGMLLQGVALLLFLWARGFEAYVGLSALLGLGTALVYPTFLAAIADYTHPQQRAESIGVFRLWRDLGYAIGALLTGLLADLAGLDMPVLSIGLLTLLSAVVIQVRMRQQPFR